MTDNSSTPPSLASTPAKRRTAHAANKGVQSPMSKVDLNYALETSYPEEEDDSIWTVETDSTKLNHPDPVAESASLSSVPLPELTYDLVIPEAMTDKGWLSPLQLQTVRYCCQRHEQTLPDGSRAGYLIGDGAGFGKGRIIAGIIFENCKRGRNKAVWISVSSDLKEDAVRDIRDIEADISLHSLSQMTYGQLSAEVNGSIVEGVVFSSYHCLRSVSQSGEGHHTRLGQILEWCGENFDGVIVFDECHRAKHAVPIGSIKVSKTGLIVLDLQRKLPKARIVYVSATAASEPKNMGYMVRLGLWGPGTQYETFTEFVDEVEKYGVGAMEIVAMEMKLRGMYIARQLSFEKAKFKVDKVVLSPDQVKLQEDSVNLWVELFHSFKAASKLVNSDPSADTFMWSQFWSSHQRYFKYLSIAAKVECAVEIASEAVKSGKCVVIGLQSTGEARTLEHIDDEGEISDFVSTAKGVLQALIEKHFPAIDSRVRSASLDEDSIDLESSGPGTSGSKRKAGKTERFKKKLCFSDSESSNQGSHLHGLNTIQKKKELMVIKDRLLLHIEKVGERLPPNTLDQLVDKLGGPGNVAEMTGRKGGIVQNEKGEIRYKTRSEVGVPREVLNIRERERFMAGEKNAGIISEAGSSGFSLHADRRAGNKRQRVHILLELPWSADVAIQQFGRTHRSNQVSAPEYRILISDIAGEQRFASTVAKRLETLGALTHGDRRATNFRELGQFRIDTKHGLSALYATMNAVMGFPNPVVKPPHDYEGEFFKDVIAALVNVGLMLNSGSRLCLDKEITLERFLNRILGIPFKLQNKIFQYFSDTLAAIVIREKNFDRVLNVVEDSRCLKRTFYHIRLAIGTSTVVLATFKTDRGMSWNEASERCSVPFKAGEGFYVSLKERHRKPIPLLLMNSDAPGFFSISKPGSGTSSRFMSAFEINRDYVAVDQAVAELNWVEVYKSSESECSHMYRNGKCSIKDCQFGLRQRIFNMVSGSILFLLDKFASVLGTNCNGELQMVRLQSEGRPKFGINVPSSCMPQIIKLLTEASEYVSEDVL